MFIGEAPGADEDASGKPFIGRAGQLLNKIIEAIGMKREDVFIGNVNRCRPPQNRTPTPAEAKTCKPFLLREIAIVQPQVLVVLGNTAMKNLLDTKEGITKLRGEFQDYRGIKVMPTFHPAYLLRDPSKKRETWDDMKKVREYLQKNPRKTGATRSRQTRGNRLTRTRLIFMSSEQSSLFADAPAATDETLADINAELLARVQALPQFSGRILIFGEGQPNLSVAVIGESPGAPDIDSGRPFMGPCRRHAHAHTLRHRTRPR
jgi:DNA polymerase